MSEPEYVFDLCFGYVQLVQWTERHGNQLRHMCRGDRYGRDGVLQQRGEVSCTGVLHLNGWEQLVSPPASREEEL